MLQKRFREERLDRGHHDVVVVIHEVVRKLGDVAPPAARRFTFNLAGVNERHRVTARLEVIVLDSELVPACNPRGL